MALAVYCALTPVFYELRPPFAIGCAVVASVLCGMVDVGNVLSASRVITFLPFFLIGYYLEPRAILDFVNGFGERLLVPRVFAFIMILGMFLASQMLDIDELRASQMIFTGRDPYALVFPLAGDQGDISGCAIRLAGFASTAVIGVCLLLLVPQREVALLSRSGRHTLQVYIFHAFVSYAMAFLGVVPALYELMPTLSRNRRVAGTDSMDTGPISWPVLESMATKVAVYPFSVSEPTSVLSSGAFMFTSAYTRDPEGTVWPGRDTLTPATPDSAPDQFSASVQVAPSAV